MRVIEVAPFLLPRRISLENLLIGQNGESPERHFAKLRAGIAAAMPADIRPPIFGPSVVEGSKVFINQHRSLGAAEVENEVFDRTLHTEDIGDVRLYISSLSIGFAIIPLEVADLDALHVRERELIDPLNQHIRHWCHLVTSGMPPALQGPHPWWNLEPMRALWWHRVMVDPPRRGRPVTIRPFGESCTLASGTCVVGNGYTAVLTTDEESLADVVEGLLYAQQRWILTDEASKFTGKRLATIGFKEGAGVTSVDTQFTETLDLTRTVILRDVVLKNQSRHLANARLTVSQAADIVWRTAEEAAQLDDRLRSLRILTTLNWQQRQNNRDDRRNRLIFVFTAVTLFQSILLWYDFLTNQALAAAGEPRSGIAYVVLLLSVAVVFAAIFGRWLPRIRSLWWAVRTRVPEREHLANSRPQGDEYELVDLAISEELPVRVPSSADHTVQIHPQRSAEE
ncbi:MAG: hypothetical protein JO362_16445 [Streptomycetaceae bacterium]|nr:hypothetical protein [Streptomycetaceae bacterium]